MLCPTLREECSKRKWCVAANHVSHTHTHTHAHTILSVTANQDRIIQFFEKERVQVSNKFSRARDNIKQDAQEVSRD